MNAKNLSKSRMHEKFPMNEIWRTWVSELIPIQEVRDRIQQRVYILCIQRVVIQETRLRGCGHQKTVCIQDVAFVHREAQHK